MNKALSAVRENKPAEAESVLKKFEVVAKHLKPDTVSPASVGEHASSPNALMRRTHATL
ncbi:hypothetical protein [Novipirellula herctigrandis]|uniref:hypothetical protein n=1 Tax=Novipirellula herctigrandis TaxID=2527986 RepID=UPI003AF33924